MSEQDRIPPEILRKVRRIELSTRHMVDDLFGGEYHSVFKGLGMEFDEVREYSPGDEVRSIDWNVTARMGRPYVKRYREERELTVLLVVDASASGLFGSRERFKSEVIAEVASVLAFSAIRNQDKVGCLIFTDRVEKYIPPDKGHRHVLRIIRELLYFKPEGSGTDLKGTLETVSRLLKRRAVVFLVSDFYADGYETPLRLAARRHDLIALSIHDPLERELPNVGLVHMRDAETGQDLWIDTSNPWVRKRYAVDAGERQERFTQLCGRYGVDEILLDVTRDYARPLVQFFRKRQKRLAKGFRRSARALLAAGLLFAAPWSGADAQAPAPPGRAQQAPAMPPGGMQPGMQPGPGQAAPGMQPGQPGQAPGGPSLPVIPRDQLEQLDLPSLTDLTGSARPRVSEASGSGIRVTSRLDRDLQTIGERNAMTWTVVLDKGVELLPLEWDLGVPGQIQLWPDRSEKGDLDPTLMARISAGETLKVEDFIRADTLRTASADTLRYSLAFTTFLPDTFAFPAQHFAYQSRSGGSPGLLETDPLTVACLSVLALGPDSSALRDWKAPGELRANWWPVIARWGLPLLLLLAVAAALFLWWWRRRRAREAAAVMVPPDVEALEALEGLALEDLPGRGLFAEYYFRLSHIVRHYLSRRYALPFIDWTSEEIRSALLSPMPRIAMDPDLSESLVMDLDRGDLVKFAQRKPSRAQCQDSLSTSRRVIMATRLVEEAATESAPAAEAEAGPGGTAKAALDPSDPDAPESERDSRVPSREAEP